MNGIGDLRPRKRPAQDDNRRELTWIAVAFSDFERAIIDELFRRGGFGRLDDVVLAGLWQLARQLDVPVNAFTLGARRRACLWTADESGGYSTACGHTIDLPNETIIALWEAKFDYCGFCSGKVETRERFEQA